MNISLTNRCSRRCEYCFQKEWFLESPERPLLEMPLELYKWIITNFKPREFKILGGEPLLYAHIDDVFAIAGEHGSKIDMLSNISVQPELVRSLIPKYNNVIEGWLINSDYTPEQEDMFMENLKYIAQYTNNFSLATTLVADEEKIKINIDRVKKIYKEVPSSRREGIRIAPATPTYNDVFKKYDFTNIISRFVDSMLEDYPDMQFGFDCPNTACELNYEYREYMAYCIKPDNRFCNRPVFDIMPDGSACWCSSARFLCVPDVTKYSSLEEVEKALIGKWKEYWLKVGFPEECRHCYQFKPGRCYGWCAGKNNAIFSGD